MWMKSTLAAILAVSLFAPPIGMARGSNILLIIGDDMGIDSFSLYNSHTDATFPPTPNLDALAARGILFANAYANPVCSPTRAAIMTGRDGYRTGVMQASVPMSPDEYTLPEVFAAQSPDMKYSLASFGKWHLGGGDLGPNTVGGWPHFAGSLGGAVSNYRRWTKVVDGVSTNLTSTYATRENTSNAIKWIDAQDTNESWFAWIGYNAAHTPLHKPPVSMHSYDSLPATEDDIATNARPYFEAMVEAMDFQIGRLLGEIDTNATTVVFIGDNGTAGGVIQPPYDMSGRAKGSVYEGGTHVPMIVAGPDVVDGGRTNDSVVHCVDLFATIIELAGGTVPSAGVDSRSLIPILRNQPFHPEDDCILMEIDSTKYSRAIRNDQYKLIRQGREKNDEFYDMLADPLEGTNLLDGAMNAGQQAAYDDLYAGLAAATNPAVSIPTGGYPIVDTGQEDCYDDQGGSTIAAPSPGMAFAGQDALYRGHEPSYLDNADGTVTDLNTGLMWQQTPDLVNQSTWTNAVNNASSLTLGGHTDWRLPTIKELYSLIDFSGRTGQSEANARPYLDTNYFHFVYGDTNVVRYIDAQYWTSTEYVHFTMDGDETVFGVNFADGRIKGYPKFNKGSGTASEHFVRYVRGNPEYGVNAFANNGDGTVTDFATGLMWQRGDNGTMQNWEQALAYAEGLGLAGYSDWRLPNAKELQSIVDYTRAPMATGSAAIDTNFFNVTETESFYWTSTTHLDGATASLGNYAVYLSFGRALGWMEQPADSGNFNLLDVHGAGAQRSDPKSGTPVIAPPGHGPQGDILRIHNYVRCVRCGADEVSIDSDGDGLSDWYEHNYSGSTTGMDPLADDDGDGMGNRDEERSGTVPTDGSSRLALTHVATIAPTATVVRWRSELGQAYTVESSTNILTEPFSTVAASGIPATPPENTYTHTTPEAVPQRLYRVRTE